MSSVQDAWYGTPGKTSLAGYTPWIKAPGYDFSSKLYDYLGTLIGQPSPRFGGFGAMDKAGRQQNPWGDKITDLAGKYMNMGMPTVFGQATGTLGRFANPSFANPTARLQLGAPNYFGNQAIPPPGGAPQPIPPPNVPKPPMGIR